MPAKKKPKARRTQEERRGETKRKVLDAATEALIELGYAGASVQKICERAGVSQGGLFRHYPTREALMVAVGEDIAGKMLATYTERFEAARKGREPIGLAMRLVREQCQSSLNQAWYELAIASRTSAALQKALEPVGRRYHERIEDLAYKLLPDLAEALGDRFPVIVETIIAVFDGEAIHRLVLQGDAPAEEARIELLSSFAGLLAAASSGVAVTAGASASKGSP